MPEKREMENLGDMLLREGLINHAQMEEARKRREKTPEKTIGRILVDMGVITESVKMSFLRKKFGYDFFSLENRMLDPEILTFIPRSIAVKYHLVPVHIVKGSLVVAMDDPSDLALLDNLKTTVGMPIRPVIATASDISQALTLYPEDEDEEFYIEEKTPSILFRIFRYSAFPILGFLPLALFFCLLKFNENFLDKVTYTFQASSSFNFDVFLYTLLGWGIWIILMWEINGLIFHGGKHRASKKHEEGE